MLFVFTIHIKLSDVVHGDLVLLQFDLVRFRSEIVGKSPYVVRESR